MQVINHTDHRLGILDDPLGDLGDWAEHAGGIISGTVNKLRSGNFTWGEQSVPIDAAVGNKLADFMEANAPALIDMFAEADIFCVVLAVATIGFGYAAIQAGCPTVIILVDGVLTPINSCWGVAMMGLWTLYCFQEASKEGHKGDEKVAIDFAKSINKLPSDFEFGEIGDVDPKAVVTALVRDYGIDYKGNLRKYRHRGWPNGDPDNWAHDEIVGYDGWDAYLTLFATSSGVMYGIAQNGSLYWYMHSDNTWKGRKKVSSEGWSNYSTVFATGSGVIYGIHATNGNLYWWRHSGWLTGTNDWSARKKVGTDWGQYKNVFATDNGIIYGVKISDGSLYWWRHDGWMTGNPNAWTGPKKVGVDWGPYMRIFATDNGIIYAVKESDGDLYWWRHDGWMTGDPNAWTGKKLVGTDWAQFRRVFAADNGVIYAVT